MKHAPSTRVSLLFAGALGLVFVSICVGAEQAGAAAKQEESFSADDKDAILQRAEQEFSKGQAHQGKKEYDQAVKCFNKALKGRSSVYGGAHSEVALTYEKLGIVFGEMREHAQSIASHKKALAVWLKVDGPEYLEAATAYVYLGLAYGTATGTKEHSLAIENYEKALKIRLKALGPEHLDVAEIYNLLGIEYSMTRQPDLASRNFEKELAINLKALEPDHLDVARAYRSLGFSYGPEGAKKNDLSVENYEKALGIYLKVLGPVHLDVAGVYSKMGLALGFKGRKEYSRAIDNYEKALAIYLKVHGPEHPQVAKTYKFIGVNHGNQRQIDLATEKIEKALAIYLKVYGLEHREVASLYWYLGFLNEGAITLSKRPGEYDLAIKNYERALGIWLKLDDPDEVAKTYHSIAGVYKALRRFEKEVEYHKKALLVEKKEYGEEHETVVRTYILLGSAWHGETVFTQSAEDRLRYVNQGIVYFEKARTIQLRVLGSKNPAIAETYIELGKALKSKAKIEKKKPPGKTLEYYQAALELLTSAYGADSRKLADIYEAIGDFHTGGGDYALADKFYRKVASLEKDRLLNLAMAARNKGRGAQEGSGGRANMKKAFIYLDEYLTNLRKPGSNNGVRDVAYEQHLADMIDFKGKLYFEMGNRDVALHYARKAYSVRQGTLKRTFSFSAEKDRLAEGNIKWFYHFAILGSAPDLALSILQNKGLVLDSIIEDRLVAESATDPQVGKALARLGLLNQQLGELKAEGGGDPLNEEAIRLRYSRIAEQVENQERELARLVGGLHRERRAHSVTVDQVSGALGKDEVLVEFLLESVTKRYYAVVIHGAGPVFKDWWDGEKSTLVTIGSIQEVENAIEEYRELHRGELRQSRLTVLDGVLRTLGEKLFEPIEKKLPEGVKKVILSPDASINFVSFAALKGKDGEFLGERFDFSYVSSGRDLLFGNAALKRGKDVAVFANPDFDLAGGKIEKPKDNFKIGPFDRERLRGLNFKPLPGTEEEATSLKELAVAKGMKVQTYLGDRATEGQAAKLRSPAILHIATHGIFLERERGRGAGGARNLPDVLSSPMHRSGLALAGAKKTMELWDEGRFPPFGNDGFLTAQEVGTLDLKNTWLAVLSACNTGEGKAIAGEGVLGLRRGFVKAGAQNLLMTLWKAGDKTTAGLMKDFYEQALESGDAPGALVEVQRKLLKKLRATYEDRFKDKKVGTALAALLAGPFVVSFQRGNEGGVTVKPSVEAVPDPVAVFKRKGDEYQVNGQYDLAAENYNKALEILLKDGGRKVLLAGIYNQGGSNYSKKGEQALAIANYEKALAVGIEIWGPDHRYLGSVYSNLGGEYGRAKQHVKSLESYKTALKILSKWHGPDHEDVGRIYNWIGLHYGNSRQVDLAIPNYEKALEIWLKVRGPDHLDTAMAYINLGSCYGQKGEDDLAIDNFGKGLAIRLKVLGPNHPAVAEIYPQIGRHYGNKGQEELAIENYEKGLKIYLKTHGPEHPWVVIFYSNLGSSYGRKGQYDLAIENFEKELKIRLKISGPDHAKIAEIYNVIGIQYDRKGQSDLAITNYEKALAIWLKSDGPEPLAVAAVYSNLGSVYELKAEYGRAIESYEKCLEILVKEYGATHIRVADTQASLSLNYLYKGEHEKAAAIYGKALQLLAKAPREPQPALSNEEIISRAKKAGYHEVFVYLLKGALEELGLFPEHYKGMVLFTPTKDKTRCLFVLRPGRTAKSGVHLYVSIEALADALSIEVEAVTQAFAAEKLPVNEWGNDLSMKNAETVLKVLKKLLKS